MTPPAVAVAATAHKFGGRPPATPEPSRKEAYQLFPEGGQLPAQP